nr:hypothetical protein [Deltaproteobacteria bacterium]
AFYRVLVERNVFQILAEQHGPTRTVMQRLQPGLWASVVRQYVDAHPPTHWHPSYVGAGLSEFLAECREAGDQRIDPLFEEVADFCWVRMLAQRCPDGVGDGFEQRLFIRQYTRPIAPLVAAITEDPNAPIPPPQPVVVFIYRHWRDLDVRVFSPSAAGLVALARRQGATVPEALQAVPPEDVEAADTLLVEHGVLVPADASSPG